MSFSEQSCALEFKFFNIYAHEAAARLQFKLNFHAFPDAHIKSAEDKTAFANFYLWAGNRHERFKARDEEILLEFRGKRNL